MIKLKALSLEDMEFIREERAYVMETLRTPFLLTKEMQADYYDDVICDRRSGTRYWALWSEEDNQTIGYGGIENIEWENRTGEISILIGRDFRGKGYGRQGVDLFLDQAFYQMNLHSVWGECYYCGHLDFWKRICDDKKAYTTVLVNRKYYQGRYWPSLYFNFER